MTLAADTAYLPASMRERAVITQAAGNAMSDAGRTLREKLANVLVARESVSLGQRAWDLERACFEASRSDWDGPGTKPVSRATYRRAAVLLKRLPRTFPNPEIVAHPDGEVAFTWSNGPKEIFSVSVASSGRLSYAALYGKSSAYGAEWLSELTEALPAVVEDHLARLFPSGLESGPG